MKLTHNPEEVWLSQVNKLKMMFPNLSDEDFQYDYGAKEVMMNKLQKKLKRTREELNSLLIGL
jgi:hypothetical protein